MSLSWSYFDPVDPLRIPPKARGLVPPNLIHGGAKRRPCLLDSPRKHTSGAGRGIGEFIACRLGALATISPRSSMVRDGIKMY